MSQQNQTKNQTFSSPYHFVPMAKEVHYPEWQNISHDQPEENCLSGEISYELKNYSPLLIGDERVEDSKGNIVNFFKTPDNQFAIPGSSLKGMIRNWLEIVTHSRLSIINNNHLSFRDLANNEYKDLLTETISEKQYKAKSKAGWLQFTDEQWVLYPANLWRVENKDIEKTFNIRINDREAKKIYKKLNGIQSVSFTEEKEKAHPHSCGELIYAKASHLSKSTNKNNYLIVTGQVSSKKHMNFIFSSPKPEAISFKNNRTIKSFLEINSESETFIYLKGLNHNQGIPVFFLEENSQVSNIGLAQMFRIPYKYTVGELREESHCEQNEKLDFCELLFGKTDNENESLSLKGRVNFSLAKLQSNNAKPIQLEPTVLGEPRNSFYPAYIDQTTAKKKYHTYNQKESKLAGFKRYPVHQKFNFNTLPKPPEIRGEVNYKVATQLCPLPEQQLFTGKVRFHNLKPQELEAILFALKLTDKTNLYHQLGMGKPLGLGKIKFSNLKVNVSKEVSDSTAEFEKYIEQNIKSTITLQQLILLQTDKTFKPEELTYLDFPKGFTSIKKDKNKKLINLKEKAIENEQKIIKEKEEQERIQKIKSFQEKQEEKRNKKTLTEELLIKHLNGEINKSSLTKLIEQPERYKNFSSEDIQQLKNKIEVSPWFKSLKKKRSNWRKQLPKIFIIK